jgi:hypothetical protein
MIIYIILVNVYKCFHCWKYYFKNLNYNIRIKNSTCNVLDFSTIFYKHIFKRMELSPKDEGYDVRVNNNEFSFKEKNENDKFTRFEALPSFQSKNDDSM